MQGWKEKMSKLSQWELKGVPMVYPIAFVILLLPILFWNFNNIRYFDEFEIAPDSARYLLSALVQSLAAIIAIVVTLTLVAVQLAASAYSPRVIDIFKKDRVMWLLLVWYGLSIFFGLFVLEMIGGKYQSLGHWGVSLESCFFLAYLMGIAAFAGLFFHIGNVIDLLKPENIIRRLSGDITRENVLEHIESVEKNKKDKTKPIVKDPIQPIVDIIHGSVMKYDIATTGYGLKAITEKAIEAIHLDRTNEISGHFCTHLERIGKLAVSREDDESVIKVLESLESFGKSTAEDSSTSRAAWHLGIVGVTAAEKRLILATLRAAESLGYFGKFAVEHDLNNAADTAARYIGSIGKAAAAEKELNRVARQAAISLKVVGVAAAEKVLSYGTKNVIYQVASSLVVVGVAATKNELEDMAEMAAVNLAELTRLSEEFSKIAIQNYRSQLRERDRDSFQKFMQMYEKHSKKSRSEKSE